MFLVSGLLVILLQSTIVITAPAPKDACSTGKTNGCIQALLNQPDRNGLEFCSTYIQIPLFTTTVATAYPTTTVTTEYPITTVDTTTPLATATVTITATETQTNIPLPRRALNAVVEAFGPEVVSSACSCVANSISTKTTSVTATITRSVTATSWVPTTEIAATLTVTETAKVTQTVLAPQSCRGGGRVVQNGDFASGLDQWALTRDSQNTCAVQNGIFTSELRLNPNGGSATGCIIGQTLATCAGKTYKFSMRYYIHNGGNAGYLNGFIDHNWLWSIHTDDGNNVGSWKTLTGTFVASTDGTLFEIFPICWGWETNFMEVANLVIEEA